MDLWSEDLINITMNKNIPNINLKEYNLIEVIRNYKQFNNYEEYKKFTKNMKINRLKIHVNRYFN